MAESKKEVIFNEIASNDRYRNGNYHELADKHNIDKATVRNYAYQYRKEYKLGSRPSPAKMPTPREWSVDTELANRKENAFIKNLENKLKQTTEQLEKQRTLLTMR